MPQHPTVKPKADVDFEAVFHSLPVPFLLMDRDFNIVALNKAFCDSTAAPPEEFIGRHVFAAFPAEPESHRILKQSFERTRDQGVIDIVPVVSYGQAVNGRSERSLWSCAHIPVRDGEGRVAFVLKSAQDISGLRSPRELAGMPLSAACEDEQLKKPGSLEVLNETLMATCQHLRGLVMQAPSFMCVLRGPGLVFEMVNTAFSMLAGGRDLIGKSLREGLPELEGQDYLGVLESIFQTGDVHVGRKTRIFLQDPKDRELEEHFIDFVAQPIMCIDGRVTGLFIEGNDVTDHVRTEERQALLIRELHHRVRNMLAIVQGLLTTSASTAASFEDFQQAFCERIASLAKTHAVMTEGLDQSVSFHHLLTQELGPYADEHGLRIRLSGPHIDLASQIAVPLGMAIHELTTNAVKHGALASEEGQIDVSWTLAESEGETTLVCEWNEFACQRVAPPRREGFGSMLLNRVLAQQIRAEVKVEFLPGGLKLRMAIPLQAGQ